MAKGRKKLQIKNFTSSDLDALLAMARIGITSKEQLHEHAYSKIKKKTSERRLRSMIKEGLITKENKQIKKIGLVTFFSITEEGKKILQSKNLISKKSFKKTKCNQYFHDMKLGEIYFRKIDRTTRLTCKFKSETELLQEYNLKHKDKLHDMIDFAIGTENGWYGFESIGVGYTEEMIQSKINIGKLFKGFHYE